MGTGKARTTRKSVKSSGKTRTRPAARKTKATTASKPAAKRTKKKVAKRAKPTTTKKPKTVAKPKKKAVAAKPAARSSTTIATVGKKSVSRATRAPRPQPPTAQATPVTVQWGTETIELAQEGRAVPKTKLTKKQLREFKALLLDKRRELVGDVRNLTDQALRGNSSGGGGSNMPLHMADVGSDNWEQEFTLGLIDNERLLVQEIDEALQRIEVRTFGVCVATHRPIDIARLRAKPWAKYCVEYARLRELGRVP